MSQFKKSVWHFLCGRYLCTCHADTVLVVSVRVCVCVSVHAKTKTAHELQSLAGLKMPIYSHFVDL